MKVKNNFGKYAVCQNLFNFELLKDTNMHSSDGQCKALKIYNYFLVKEIERPTYLTTLKKGKTNTVYMKAFINFLYIFSSSSSSSFLQKP